MQHRLSYTATISAQYVHLVQAFRPGGLQGQYFAGTSFVGPALAARVDPELAFSWQDGDVTPQAHVPLSVRWTGVLWPALNETYTLILRSSAGIPGGGGGGVERAGVGGNARSEGGARVWLQGKLVMQLSGGTEEEEARVDLLGNRWVWVWM